VGRGDAAAGTVSFGSFLLVSPASSRSTPRGQVRRHTKHPLPCSDQLLGQQMPQPAGARHRPGPLRPARRPRHQLGSLGCTRGRPARRGIAQIGKGRPTFAWTGVRERGPCRRGQAAVAVPDHHPPGYRGITSKPDSTRWQSQLRTRRARRGTARTRVLSTPASSRIPPTTRAHSATCLDRGWEPGDLGSSGAERGGLARESAAVALAGVLAHERLRGPSCSPGEVVAQERSALPEVALPSSPEDAPRWLGDDLERRCADRGGPA
jgi:hypothetical protein